ncbi:histidine phosphatase family protein [Ornithinimicrobium cerasi]|uniref:Broad specificity phosphatase PhoE n=1 Tax=Ornithinimicrobium cerasi TaxID=2248773 RepID=A0A285VUQ3_9MICO|nr:histidine phosphatase family protein [Ornithinimicrobium cerasi]SOC56371.1 Broad specificity phosphatase PhoE [Ornithinimicrobium cerasi]
MSQHAGEADVARASDSPRADADAPGPRTLHDGTPVTLVHVVRHGEVHNPERILYGRLPGYSLSELGGRMAQAAADALADRDVVHVVSSPLDRARETAAPIAAAHGLPVGTDERLTESTNRFEGLTPGRGAGAFWRPEHWPSYVNPLTPSWGEPYSQIASRMHAALASARKAASGHEAVLVSHQLPIWTLRRSLEGRRLWHHPRRRRCTLASVTSVLFHGSHPVRVTYTEPAAHLLAGALDVTGVSTERIEG